MSRTIPPTDAELAAYFAGHLTAARAAEIEAWIASHPANAAWSQAVRSLIATPMRNDLGSPDRIWSGVRRAITSETPASRQPTPVFRGRLGSYAAVAAGTIAVVAGSLYTVAHLSARSDSGMRSYATHRGERVTVQLLDGTRVTLAPESRLRISAGFGAHDRAVELEGEAAFSVVHDSTRPFTVKAGPALVVDVGTQFDLRAYSGDRVAQVAVAEGSVAIGAASPGMDPRTPKGSANEGRGAEGVLVSGGEVGQLDVVGHATTSKIGNSATYFAWTHGRLVFERRPLREVLGAIARWYDMDVTVRDSVVADRLVTAEFSTESPSEMIQALAHAVNASVAGSGRTFTLSAR